MVNELSDVEVLKLARLFLAMNLLGCQMLVDTVDRLHLNLVDLAVISYSLG